ncbi:hypothetical protein BT96DRAFT_920028 [Gymnopus androsaceus JB14]|uniref:Uncharacterized protein n=1 Tax=Gymnopus androsaceus JB14 TaxID=1447944 RepID=A0A6A4HRH1_9AGAR|nr:hypothetical protein BT96DRAFT_920028 [Gymnopus androsaceus JB14]
MAEISSKFRFHVTELHVCVRLMYDSRPAYKAGESPRLRSSSVASRMSHRII